ncbi:MAG: DUF58 domain-containing protein [Zoogloeaceae bacterium]|nr:DUF58 domain-containing protein [Zoogloeaceae bacterium]
MRLLANASRWLFRLQREEQSPIILNQRRIFILPTGAGLLFGAVLIVMLIGAINYTLSLGHALVFLLASLGLIAMVHTFRNLLGLTIQAGRSAPVFAGELARFPLYLSNHRDESRCKLEFQFDKLDSSSINLPERASASVHVTCPARHRGRLKPGRIILHSRYPLGLFRAWSYLQPDLSCVVYPTPIARPLPPPTAIAEPGSSRGNTGQEDFSGLRLHNPSDSPRHIAWKAVARSVDAYPLLVKHFAGGAHQELWLDWGLTASEADDETRLSILAGWIISAESAQLRYGLTLPSQTIPPDSGTAHRERCLETLALYGHENPETR